jgi:hypothetical protein
MEIAKIGDKINNTIRISITEANLYFGFMNEHVIPPVGDEITISLIKLLGVHKLKGS